MLRGTLSADTVDGDPQVLNYDSEEKQIKHAQRCMKMKDKLLSVLVKAASEVLKIQEAYIKNI